MFRLSKQALLAASAALLMCGCASLKPGWTELPPAAGNQDSSAQVARAEALFRDADTQEKLSEVIAAYAVALELDSDNYEILVGLCETHILEAAAYASSKKEKKTGYRLGIGYCDRAMYTNPEFRDLVDRGVSLGDAVGTLTEREAKAMILWVTGVSYYFKECLGGISRLYSYRLIMRTEPFLDRMMEIDPDYLNGVVHFSRGIYYLGLPKFAGGDRELSAELMNRAEEVGPDSMLVRWGRAKYYYFETNDRGGFERDLRWVVQQDPRESSTPYAWNVYFQRDGITLLENVEQLF
ncbi:MAG: TRAP transporter TatT component family protein [Thermoanaerobaculia bacterium]